MFAALKKIIILDDRCASTALIENEEQL